jgi:hypothetical protein
MAKLRINGEIYEAPSIEIKNGNLIVGDVNLGVIGYECCIVALEGTVLSISEPGYLKWV